MRSKAHSSDPTVSGRRRDSLFQESGDKTSGKKGSTLIVRGEGGANRFALTPNRSKASAPGRARDATDLRARKERVTDEFREEDEGCPVGREVQPERDAGEGETSTFL